MCGEACAAVEVNTPEAHFGAVLKFKMISACTHKAVLSCGALGLEYKGYVYRHIIVKKRIGNVFCHFVPLVLPYEL